MIELNQVSYRYDNKSPYALSDVTTGIGPGMHLLMGENGAGKTTLLKIIAGLLIPTQGECMLDGTDVSLRIPDVLCKICYLGSDSTAPLSSIKEMEKRHACFFPTFSAEKLKSNLDTFGIDAKQKLRDMSMGTRHKALLSYVISLNTQYLLLDEPTNGLDIESKDKLQKLLIELLDEEKTIIVSTHNVSDMRSLYDGVMVMQGSQLAFNAYTDDITESMSFVTSYSEIPGSIFSAWVGGSLHSILPNDLVEQQNMKAGPVDYQLLYMAAHSPSQSKVISLLNGSIPFGGYSNGK